MKLGLTPFHSPCSNIEIIEIRGMHEQTLFVSLENLVDISASYIEK